MLTLCGGHPSIQKYSKARGQFKQLDLVDENKRLPLLRKIVHQIELPWDTTRKHTGRRPSSVKFYQDLVVFVLWQEAYQNVKSERSYLKNLNNDKEELRKFGFLHAPSRSAVWRVRNHLTQEYKVILYKTLNEICVNELLRKKAEYRREYYKKRKAEQKNQTD